MTDPQNQTNKTDAKSIEDGLSGLITAIGDTFSEAISQLESNLGATVSREHEVETAHGPLHAQASIQVRLGGLGETMQETPPPEDEEFEPAQMHYQLMEDETCWRLAADIPGVAFQDLSLSKEAEKLIIQTKGARRYRAILELNDQFSLDDVAVSLRHGVLNLQVGKTGPR